MKMIRREFLGIYIFDNPTDPAFKEFNEVMLQKAETIRCQRQISLLNEEFNLPDNTKRNADALKKNIRDPKRKNSGVPYRKRGNCLFAVQNTAIFAQ